MLSAAVFRNTGINLSDYRASTVSRRIATRLTAVTCRTYREYLDLLERDPDEAGKLISHLTIKWSTFFRDAAFFASMRTQLLPELLDREPAVRIWSAGCGRGEEAYSLAILMTELDRRRKPGRWEIEATDVDETALADAARRTYGARSLENVPDHVVRDFFSRHSARTGVGYRLHDDVGERVRFSRHDLLSGMARPLSPYHLVLCRNVTIYFQSAVHGRVFDLLASSVSAGGYLCLGEAEQLPAAYTHEFDTIDRKTRIYRKKS